MRGRGPPPPLLTALRPRFLHIELAGFLDRRRCSRRAGGAGLGLTLCRKIAEVHGSSLRFESVVGEGTRVSFLLKGEQK